MDKPDIGTGKVIDLIAVKKERLREWSEWTPNDVVSYVIDDINELEADLLFLHEFYEQEIIGPNVMILQLLAFLEAMKQVMLDLVKFVPPAEEDDEEL